jgi:hypothetical protein
MELSAAPRPICDVPEAVATDWARTSWNVVLLDLYPMVFTLAMLSPITLMALPLVERPLIPENSALDILICASYSYSYFS